MGLVLGCSRLAPDGRLNLFFLERVGAAAELYKQGKVDYLLVSGDNSVAGDDEPKDFKTALMSRGVPGERIYLDYAGFRTLDSVIRVKEVFGQGEVTIISQEFQNERAIFFANHSRLDAISFSARDVVHPPTRFREYFARVKAVLDVYVFRIQPRAVAQKLAIGAAVQSPTGNAQEAVTK